MKYKSILLKSISIALFFLNISTMISVISFLFYCLLQQSSMDIFSLGPVPVGTHKAKDVEAIHRRVNHQYSIVNITEAIQQQYREDYENHDIPPKFFQHQARLYANYLSFCNINMTIARTDPSNIFEAITHIEVFPHIAPTMSNELAEKVTALYNPKEPTRLRYQKTENYIIFDLGYHRHFRLLNCYYPEQAELSFLLQIGNQYKLKCQLKVATLYVLIMTISLALLIPNPIYIVIAGLSISILTQLNSTTSHLNINIGHDPRSIGSFLFSRNLSSGDIEYKLGNITLNALINVLLFFSFSLIGAPDITTMLSLPLLIATAVFTAYDRYLVSTQHSHQTIPLFYKPNNSTKQRLLITKEALPGFSVSPSISKGLRRIHHAAFSFAN